MARLSKSSQASDKTSHYSNRKDQVCADLSQESIVAVLEAQPIVTDTIEVPVEPTDEVEQAVEPANEIANMRVDEAAGENIPEVAVTDVEVKDSADAASNEVAEDPSLS